MGMMIAYHGATWHGAFLKRRRDYGCLLQILLAAVGHPPGRFTGQLSQRFG
jgi:hypothetical protein|tara:strand:+ start:13 stop:165 length:153 start_codon:yes stop_codon:yes gene_type:complete